MEDTDEQIKEYEKQVEKDIKHAEKNLTIENLQNLNRSEILELHRMKQSDTFMSRKWKQDKEEDITELNILDNPSASRKDKFTTGGYSMMNFLKRKKVKYQRNQKLSQFLSQVIENEKEEFFEENEENLKVIQRIK